MSKKNEIKGNCACGNVKYKIEGNPLFTQACHCKNCKLSTGSSFVIHTMVMTIVWITNEEPVDNLQFLQWHACVNKGFPSILYLTLPQAQFPLISFFLLIFKFLLNKY